MSSICSIKSSLLTMLNRHKDLINGGFELFGGGFIFLNILHVWHSKSVAGVDWRAVGFFTLWGYWNLFYYAKLDQRLSLWGGVSLAVTNTIWLSLLIYYGVIYG